MRLGLTDTIAAVSTAPGESGIGIIRISGEDSFLIADKVLDRKISDKETHTIHFRHAVKEGRVLDEVLVSVMRAPRSYTGENTAEINCHGGTLVVQQVLEEVLRAGARLAEPGEFTKRAFLNGKKDLSQAEAVMDVIQAKNRLALEAAEQQLSGGLSAEIRSLRDAILDETAWIEAALDDPEHYDLSGYPEELKGKLTGLTRRIEKLIRNADSGIVIKEGIRTVILGRPNAGKSSLMNLIAGTDRAIVTDIAGTTRDTLTEHIRLSGLSLNLTDTAGIRDTSDPVEKLGVEKARQAAEQADLILCVIDGSEPVTEEEWKLLDSTRSRKAIVLLNKSDLEQKVTEEELRKRTDHPVILFSAKEKKGMDELEKCIRELFFSGEISINEQICVTSTRHKEALEKALASLRMVGKSIEEGMPEDFFSIDLQDAYETLGVITGETVEDDVIARIFERFCTGK